MSVSVTLKLTDVTVTQRSEPVQVTRTVPEVLLTGIAGPAGPAGPGGALGYWGSFYDLTDQPIIDPDIAQPINIDSTVASNGVSIVDGNKVLFSNAGVYSMTFSIQITNYASSIEKAIFWVKLNDVDYPDSATEIDMQPRKSHNNPNRQVITINYVAEAEDDDEVAVWWSGTSTDLVVESLPAGTSPVSPAVPSIILTAVQVMYTQEGPQGPTGPQGAAGSQGRPYQF